MANPWPIELFVSFQAGIANVIYSFKSKVQNAPTRFRARRQKWNRWLSNTLYLIIAKKY